MRYTRCKPPWVERFYNSIAWHKKRAHILRRDHYQCQCYRLYGGKPCGRVATVVHHVEELVDHPDLALEDDNLLSMAWECHELTKNKKKKPKPRGVRIIKA